MIIWFFQFRKPSLNHDTLIPVGVGDFPTPEAWANKVAPRLKAAGIEVVDPYFVNNYWLPATLAMERLGKTPEGYGPWPHCSWIADTKIGRVFMCIQGWDTERLGEL